MATMNIVTDTQGKLNTLADKIRRVNPSAAARLLRLSAAVRRDQGSMADAWAANDVHHMIDAHVIAEQWRAKDIAPFWLRLLEWLRNLLIFVPLAMTWYGISRAVSSYYAFVNAINSNPGADKTQLQLPFLYLWQQGFGGHLPGWLVLGSLAFYDFLLLFFLLLLTAVVNVRSHLRSSQKEEEAELLQEELTDALTDAALCLTDRRGQQPMDAVDIAKQLLDELAKERQRLDALALRREKELSDLKGFTDALVPISQNMLNGAGYIQNATDELRKVLQDLATPIQQMVNDQQQLLGDVGQLLQSQSETSRDVKQMMGDLKTWGTSMKDALDEFATETRGLNQLPSAITQWSNQLGSLVQQLGNQYNAQATLSQMAANAGTNLQQALKEISAASNELRSMANDFFTMMNAQKDFPNLVRSSLNDVLRDYNNAAASVAQGGNNLSYAARQLYEVANRLNGGVHP